jgi:transcriptional/translational regulatory protein YebC/TACO1
MDAAVSAGAEDYREEGDTWAVYTPMNQLATVTTALEQAGLKIDSSKLTYIPKNKKEIAGREAEVALNLVDALDAHDDVANVYSDFDISESELARITGG